MIIGIDDSGDFESDRLGIYGVIFIRPGKTKLVERKFLEWERSLPASSKEDGEVKGKNLSKDQILDFTHKILSRKRNEIKVQAYAIEINDSHSSILKLQREKNLVQYRRGVDEYRRQGKEFRFIAGQYSQLADWLSSKSVKTLYKIELLGITIVNSLNLGIITSTLMEFDSELEELSFKIDQGITGRKSTDEYWRDIMRTTIWNLTSTVIPIIHIKEWSESHPFVKKFYKFPKSNEKLGILNEDFKETMQFYDSKHCYEVRMADIIANSIFRHFVLNEDLSEVLSELSKLTVDKSGVLIKVRLSGNDNPNPINPYTDKIDGITADEINKKYSN